MENKFLRGVAFLPDLVGGEILYGWAGQYHRLSGNVRPIRSSMQLFGDVSAGFRRDFPSQLDHFVEVTNGVFGDAETLVYERSLLGFFAPFQSAAVVHKVTEKMKGNAVKTLKADLGLLANRFGASHQLKACPDCAKEDLEKFCISKWYLEHQWPTSWVCRKHRRALRVVKRDVLPRNLRELLLPQDIPEGGWECILDISSEQIERLSKAVDFCANLAMRRHCHLDLELLRYTYLLGAKKYGWIRTDGAVRSALWEAFQSHYSGLGGLLGFENGKLGSGDQHFVVKLMRQALLRQHPIRHYLLMAFLFDSPDEFDVAYTQVTTAFSKDGITRVRELLSMDWREELRRLIEAEKMSISGAARVLSITFSEAKSSVKNDEIDYRKHAVLDAKQEDKLRRLILDGVDRREIEQKMGIKQSFLGAYMRKRPKLREAWCKRNAERVRLDSRTRYQMLTQQHQLNTVKKLQKFPKSKFYWLRQYDFEWLIKNSPPLVTAVLLANGNGINGKH